MLEERLVQGGSVIKVRYHTLASLGCGLAFYLVFKSLAGSLVCFAAGVLVDVDHYFDYVRDTGLNFNIRRFFRYTYKLEYDQLFIVFHAFEYLVPLALILVISEYNLLLVAASIGFVQHLLLDQLFNPVKPFAYFILYRLKNKCSKQSLLQEDYIASVRDS